MRAALTALAGRGVGTGGVDGPLRWPEDLAPHPDAGFEAREWLAVLGDGAGGVWGLRQRLTRVALPGVAADTGADPEGGPHGGANASPWRYAAALRADGALERTGRPRERWAFVEREAVGLGGLRGGPDAGLELLGHRVGTVGELPGNGCAVRWRVAVPDVARLEARGGSCPSGRRVAGAAVAAAGAFAVEGTLADGVPVSGVAWQRLAWGAPSVPDAGAAVVLESALLALEGLGSVELLRSRRASGRGTPRTTLVALDARARRAGLVDGVAVEWLDAAPGGRDDEGEIEGGVTDASAASRDAGRLRVPALGVDVRLRALSPVAAEDDGPERAFRGAVIATGSHRGAGFVELRPAGNGSGVGETGRAAAAAARDGDGEGATG